MKPVCQFICFKDGFCTLKAFPSFRINPLNQDLWPFISKTESPVTLCLVLPGSSLWGTSHNLSSKLLWPVIGCRSAAAKVVLIMFSSRVATR